MLKTIHSSRGMLVTNDVVYVEEEKRGRKARKEEAKNKLTVTVNNVVFNADTVSINYMSAAISEANRRVLEAMANDTSLTIDKAYNQIYTSTIKWKGADNVIHTIKIETLAKALEAALGAVGNIIGV